MSNEFSETRGRRGASFARQPPASWGWREIVLSFVMLGVAVVSAHFVARWGAQAGWPGWALEIVPYLILWAGFLLPLVIAGRSGRWTAEIGWSVRGIDLVYGIFFGLSLRFIAGVIEMIAYGATTIRLPSLTLLDGRLPSLFWFSGIVAAVFVAPILEELFFRGVLLRSLQNVAKHNKVVAIIVSAILFSAFHLVAGSSDAAEMITLCTTTLLVGIVCGTVVATTGRMAGALATHIVYNASWLVLALAGTFA